MNPFDLADVAGKANQAQLAFKIDAILALSSATMAEGREGLPEADKSIISRCVELSYMRCEEEGPPPDPRRTSTASSSSRTSPRRATSRCATSAT